MKKQKPSKVQKSEGLEVHIEPTGDKKKDLELLNDALRQLKKKIKKSGLMEDLRLREAYMSPSKTKRFRKNEAIKQKKRDSNKNNWSNKNKFE